MAEVTLTAFRDGDGYVSVDTNAYLQDYASHDQQLTDTLNEWLDSNGYTLRSHIQNGVMAWLRETYREELSGPMGDDEPYHTFTGNYENVLSDDIGYTLVVTKDVSLLVETSDSTGLVRLDPQVWTVDVHEPMSIAADDTRLMAQCDNDHTYTLEEAHYLHPEDMDIERGTLTDNVTVPEDEDDDTVPDKAYVACPECGQALDFETMA